MKDGQSMNFLSIYHGSKFQDFKKLLRTENDLIEDDIRLVLDEYISSFMTYEVPPCFYTFKDLSEALFNILKPEDDENIIKSY